ncbi:MAG: glycosyltransferase family 39 protein [Bacteroidota bacterium]
MKTTVSQKQLWILIAGFALFNIFMHLAVVNNFEYHRDELLYFSLGNHLAFGYASVPPMIAWIARIMQTLFGTSVFAVKLFPALLSGVYVGLVLLITKELGGKVYALILAGVATMVTIFNLRSFHLFQPVHLELVLWAIIAYVSILYVNTKKDNYLIILGIVCGLALLNKYLVSLWIVGLLLAIITSEDRIIFTKKSFYIGLGLGLLIFLPNIIWQVVNDFPVLRHINELSERQLVNVNRLEFLTDQLLMPFAASMLVVPGLIFLMISKKYRYLGIASLFVILVLWLLKGKSYYTLGIFSVLLAGGAVWIGNNVKALWLKILLPVLLVGLTLKMLPLGLPIYKTDKMVAYFQKLEEDTGMTLGRQFEDGTIHSLPQDYADQLGWKRIAELAIEAFQQAENPSQTMIYCENYGQAGAVSLIGKKHGLPEAVSFSDAYRYWVPKKFDEEIEHLIYINDNLGEDVEALFDEVKEVGRLENIHAREYGTRIYLLSKPNRPVSEFWDEVLERVFEE